MLDSRLFTPSRYAVFTVSHGNPPMGVLIDVKVDAHH